LHVDEYSDVGYINLETNLVEGQDLTAIDLQTFFAKPKNNGYLKSGQKSISNLIHYSKNELEKFTQPLLLVSIKKSESSGLAKNFKPSSPKTEKSTTESCPFLMNYNWSLQVNSGLTSLEKGQQKEDFVAQGHWKFYKFYNESFYGSDKKIVLEIQPLDNGDPDIYLTKGIDSRPT
jgi:hypothetical protein